MHEPHIFLDQEKEEDYQALLRSISWTDGFGLFFVECIPEQAERLIQTLKSDLPKKHIEVLRFNEPIDNLYDRVKYLPNRDDVHILCIKGLEYSLNQYIKSGFGGEGDYYKEDSVPRILAHLNLQRENFRDSFNICFVFFLPKFAVKYFIRRASDFYDWRSGTFEFSTDKEILEEILEVINKELKEEYLDTLTLPQCGNRLVEINTIIEDNYRNQHQNVDLLIEKGLLSYRLRLYQDAINSYDQVLAINNKSSKAWFYRGLTLMVVQRPEEAILNFDKALDIETNEDRIFKIFVNKGLALWMLGRLEETINNFDEALKIRANDYEILLDKARVLSNLGNYKEALDNYDKALKIKPDDYKILAERGGIFSILNQQNQPVEEHPIISIILKWLRCKIEMLPKVTLMVSSFLAILLLAAIANETWKNHRRNEFNKNDCLPTQTKMSGSCIDVKPENVSTGEHNILTNIKNPKRDLGIEAFKQHKYDKSIQYFEQATKDDPTDPESQIYLNNSKALQQGNPFVLAVVVPVKINDGEIAKYMLQGVADAQTEFNYKGGLHGRLLKILIANDEGDPNTIPSENAQKVANIAKILRANLDILGIIGHYSSTNSILAVSEYEKASSSPPLAMVSPTSSSKTLHSSIFFRMTASTQKMGKQLAEYANDNQIKTVTIFYNSADTYTNDMRRVFVQKDNFKGKVDEEIDIQVDQTPDIKTLIDKKEGLVLFFNSPKDMTKKATEIVKDYKKMPTENQEKMLGTSSMYSCQTLKQGGKDLEGLVLSIPWFRSNSYKYTRRAEERWNTKYLHWAIALSYDATQALIYSLSSDATRDSVLKNLQTNNLHIPLDKTSGIPIKFVKNERKIDPILVQVVEGNQEGCPNKTEVQFKPIEENQPTK